MEARPHKRKLLRGSATHSTISIGQVGLAFSRRQQCLFKIKIGTFKGALAYGDYIFPKKFEFVSLCSFICLQAVYQLSGPVCKATWNGCPSYSASYLHFTLL